MTPSFKILNHLQPITIFPSHSMLYNLCSYGRAIVQAVSRWLPTAAARGSSPGLVMWDMWWTKCRWGRFSPSTSVSPANLHSTNCSTINLIHRLGCVQ
jgi:hypothetical protein